MKNVNDWRSHNFRQEINALFAERDFNFGPDATPLAVVKESVLKVAVGFGIGSTAKGIVFVLGLVWETRKSKLKLTTKGKAFLWEEFGSGAG